MPSKGLNKDVAGWWSTYAREDQFPNEHCDWMDEVVEATYPEFDYIQLQAAMTAGCSPLALPLCHPPDEVVEVKIPVVLEGDVTRPKRGPKPQDGKDCGTKAQQVPPPGLPQPTLPKTGNDRAGGRSRDDSGASKANRDERTRGAPSTKPPPHKGGAKRDSPGGAVAEKATSGQDRKARSAHDRPDDKTAASGRRVVRTDPRPGSTGKPVGPAVSADASNSHTQPAPVGPKGHPKAESAVVQRPLPATTPALHDSSPPGRQVVPGPNAHPVETPGKCFDPDTSTFLTTPVGFVFGKPSEQRSATTDDRKPPRTTMKRIKVVKRQPATHKP